MNKSEKAVAKEIEKVGLNVAEKYMEDNNIDGGDVTVRITGGSQSLYNLELRIVGKGYYDGFEVDVDTTLRNIVRLEVV